MSGKPSSTLGFERRFNPALQHRGPDDFVAFMLADLPEPPAGLARFEHRTGWVCWAQSPKHGKRIGC